MKGLLRQEMVQVRLTMLWMVALLTLFLLLQLLILPLSWPVVMVVMVVML